MGQKKEIKYIVQVWQKDAWVSESWHHNRDYAEIVLDVIAGRGSPCRIVYDGAIVKVGRTEGRKTHKDAPG